jgi:hypothetical protein
MAELKPIILRVTNDVDFKEIALAPYRDQEITFQVAGDVADMYMSLGFIKGKILSQGFQRERQELWFSLIPTQVDFLYRIYVAPGVQASIEQLNIRGNYDKNDGSIELVVKALNYDQKRISLDKQSTAEVLAHLEKLPDVRYFHLKQAVQEFLAHVDMKIKQVEFLEVQVADVRVRLEKDGPSSWQMCQTVFLNPQEPKQRE